MPLTSSTPDMISDRALKKISSQAARSIAITHSSIIPGGVVLLTGRGLLVITIEELLPAPGSSLELHMILTCHGHSGQLQLAVTADEERMS